MNDSYIAATGRSLMGATIGSDVYSFTYNEDGIRTSKTQNGVKTSYSHSYGKSAGYIVGYQYSVSFNTGAYIKDVANYLMVIIGEVYGQ